MTGDERMPPARGHLLIVDDEPEILKALHRQFRQSYEVHTAQTAAEALEALRCAPIQVVISDQHMPDVSGAALLHQIKDTWPDVVRLLLTGYAEIQAVIDAVNEGAIYRYLTKPWQPEELAATVRAAFDRYALVAHNQQLMADLVEANRLLEARVAERTAELELANGEQLRMIEEKNRLLGMAAHDLRTPITIIRGFIDLLADPRTTPDDFTEFVGIIRGTLQDMLVLLNSLLDISAIESGKVQLAIGRVAVPDFIERVVRLQRVLGAQKQIRVDTLVEPDLPMASFDSVRIEQVLANLFSNAFKFSHSGTTVTLGVHRTSDGLEFSVTDQGVGVAEDEIERVFREFQKLKNRPTGDETSTGLGLSICRRIVELHGGRIGVESTRGQGSRFWFRLPLEPVAEPV